MKYIALLLVCFANFTYADRSFLVCDFDEGRSLHFVKNPEGYAFWVKNHSTQMLDSVSFTLSEENIDIDIKAGSLSIIGLQDNWGIISFEGTSLLASPTIYRGELEIEVLSDDSFRNINSYGAKVTNCLLE